MSRKAEGLRNGTRERHVAADGVFRIWGCKMNFQSNSFLVKRLFYAGKLRFFLIVNFAIFLA